MSKREFLFQYELSRYCVEHRAGKEGRLEAKGLLTLKQVLLATYNSYLSLGQGNPDMISFLQIFLSNKHFCYLNKLGVESDRYLFSDPAAFELIGQLIEQVDLLAKLFHPKEGNYPEFLDYDFPVPGPARDSACEQLGQAMRRHVLAIQDIMRGKENTPPKKEKAGAVSKITALKSETLGQRTPTEVDSKGLDATS